MTGHTSEHNQTGNGSFRFQVGLKPTKMCNRALSSTYSSLPMSSTPSFKVLEMFLCYFVVSNLVRRHFRSWETRASTSQVTSLSLRRHTVKLSAAFGCREKTESIAQHHHVAIFGSNLVATLRNTATCSRCSTRRAIHEVSALLTNVKYSSYEARKNFPKTACVLHCGAQKRPTRRVSRVRARRAWRLTKPFLLRRSLASTLRVLRSALLVAHQCV